MVIRMANLLSHRIFARSILAQRQDRQAATGPKRTSARAFLRGTQRIEILQKMGSLSSNIWISSDFMDLLWCFMGFKATAYVFWVCLKLEYCTPKTVG